MRHSQTKLSLSIGEETVSAILIKSEKAQAFFVFAHGAGAGMEHPFMQTAAEYLADENISTLRFNFPYMEKGKRYVDTLANAMKAVAAAVHKAHQFADGLPVFAGGKSFGGRMTSSAATENLLPEIKGIVFFGFPLHAIGKPSSERAAHLFKIEVPLLFLQGTKDKLADIGLIQNLISELKNAKLYKVEGADHSFKVSRTDQNDTLKSICNIAAKWMIDVQ